MLHRISHVYHGQKDAVAKNVTALREGLDKLGSPQPGNGMTAASLDDGATMALRLVDPIRGGTAGAPKFPQPVFFRLLWRAWRRTRAPMFREAVTLTLNELCKGGIYDHLGGGFARYATDAQWLVPHFEKMLYDNALLIELLSEVWLETRSPLYAARVRETIDWALAEMRVSDNGDGAFAFASALDADFEGVEGKYYVWSAEEIEAVLGDDAVAFDRAYDVRPHGNWEGHTILNLSQHPDADAAVADPSLAAARTRLAKARAPADSAGTRRQGAGRLERADDRSPGRSRHDLRRAALARRRPRCLHLRFHPHVGWRPPASRLACRGCPSPWHPR